MSGLGGFKGSSLKVCFLSVSPSVVIGELSLVGNFEAASEEETAGGTSAVLVFSSDAGAGSMIFVSYIGSLSVSGMSATFDD